VIDGDGVVTYRWLADNSGQEPDYDALDAAVDDASPDILPALKREDSHGTAPLGWDVYGL